MCVCNDDNLCTLFSNIDISNSQSHDRNKCNNGPAYQVQVMFAKFTMFILDRSAYNNKVKMHS